MKMNKNFIVANWKNHPKSLAEAQEILRFTNDYLDLLNEKTELSIVFCPPFIFIDEVSRILKTSHLEHQAMLGAQDIAAEDQLSLTGEVSGPMLQNLGVSYVIVGHSERRWKIGESDFEVNKKLRAVLRNEMIPIVCIGEKNRNNAYKSFLERQIKNTFVGLTSNDIRKCIIAYEPVWAISSNFGSRPDTPESVVKSLQIIQNFIIENWNLKIENFPKTLYGGSVNSHNAYDLLQKSEINGVLIGGASVNKEEFVRILEITARI